MTQSTSSRRCARLRISGRVQGVGYRDWMIDTAVSLGLDGWVRNRRDGSVEAVAAGLGEVVEDLVTAAWSGPPAARVGAVDVQWIDEQPAAGFTRKPTA